MRTLVYNATMSGAGAGSVTILMPSKVRIWRAFLSAVTLQTGVAVGYNYALLTRYNAANINAPQNRGDFLALLPYKVLGTTNEYYIAQQNFDLRGVEIGQNQSIYYLILNADAGYTSWCQVILVVDDK